MARRTYEKRSLGIALTAYLVTKGWTTITLDYGYQPQKEIELPFIAITMPPSTIKAFQLGSVENGDRVFKRRIQVDAYMESESRADAILDDIMDFIDLTPIVIANESAQELGSLICYDTESIYGDTMPPATSNPTILKWRGIVRAEMEAHYPNG